LSVHTEYSLVDSTVRIPALVDQVAEHGMPAVALTDQSNLFAMVKFYRAALRRGVKPIVGVDAWIEDPEQPAKPSRLLLLCQNGVGYRNLTRLVTRSYVDGQRTGKAVIEKTWLEGATEGLIALSGGRDGDVGRSLLARRKAEARSRLEYWQKLFPGRYYLEISRTGREGEETCLHAAVALASKTGVPLVATNDVRFISAEDFEAHEARVCIQQGHTLTDPGRPRAYSPQQYLKRPGEMSELFADLPEALENSVEIARRCSLELGLGTSVLPDFPVPDNMTVDTFLAERARAGLAERIEADTGRATKKLDTVYSERLRTELDVINGMGFPGYFLIVADFIRWARENAVPVGPGRGSGAGSLVAYALGITDLDPIEHELLFERFLNPERVSMPDFDIDFCMEGRDRVIDYVASRYGRDQVSQIITYGTMAAKAVVRDVGRVLGHAYGFVDRIAKLIPFELGITLEKALAQEPELKDLYQHEEEVRALIDLARPLEGLVRNAGKHAGGVVIAPSALTDFVPLYCESAGAPPVTQFDKDDVESIGLVKFDFLGLRTLTIIDWATRTINRRRKEQGEPPLRIEKIPMDDEETFALLKRCETTAVFQLESRGMKELIKRLQPDNFDEIVALVALFRPGPLQSGMVDDFINRKHDRGNKQIDYLHPDLQPILEPTYGVILYQEQVMQIAQVLAGYTLGEADLLRRAMGKKKPEEMAKQRTVFLDGASKRGVDQALASHIFDLMEKFAGYGFNKSHSAAYAVLSYQTAWLKARYPAAFMAAVLSSDMDHTDKIVTLIDECARMGLEVAPPDVNESEYAFSVSGPKSIRYGLGAIKGVGRNAVEGLIAERDRGGPFADLAELSRRSDLQKLNRRVFEALIRAGALDRLGVNRATLLASLDDSLRAAEQGARAAAAGQDDLFGLEAPGAVAGCGEPIEPRPEWSEQIRLAGEKETLGLYLTGHPINEYETELKQFTNGRIADVCGGRPSGVGDRGHGAARRTVTVAGLAMEVRKRGSRLTLMLDDRSARLEVTLFEDVLQKCRHLLGNDRVLVVSGALRFDEYIDDWRLTASSVMDMDEAREQFARKLVIRWSRRPGAADFIVRLRSILEPFRNGDCGVMVQYQGAQAQARLLLGEHWCVRPARELMDQLAELVGSDGVRLIYPPRLAS
jgi:DNA polymerase-3 subunit alpha